MAHGTKQTQSEDQSEYNNAKNHENTSNYAADFAGLRSSASAWVHGAGVHFLKITVSHNPRCDANWPADDEAEYSQDKNECATMRFHCFLSLEFDF